MTSITPNTFTSNGFHARNGLEEPVLATFRIVAQNVDVPQSARYPLLSLYLCRSPSDLVTSTSSR